MALRSTIISRSSPLLHFKRLSNSPSAIRFFNDKGRVFEDEERARENLYIKKAEKEKIEKQKQKLEEKEKTDKGESNEKRYVPLSTNEKWKPILLAGDADILIDFIVPSNLQGPLDGNFFTFTGMRVLLGKPIPTTFKATKASMAEFPALNGQSVSYAFLQFPVGTVNPPHTHPRASELLFVLSGSLEVGFVDTTNKLFTQTLQQGDIFVFPKGLVHFQFNNDAKDPVVALLAFGSPSAGTVSVPTSVFNTTIDDQILALSFKTDVATIQKIKGGLSSKI